MAAGALAALGAVEAWARAAYEAPGRLLSDLRAFERDVRPEDTNIVVFGTCLAELFIDQAAVRAAGEPEWRLWNMGAAASLPMDWALALRNQLDTHAVDLVVFLVSPSEIGAKSTPWESQVMELATLGDLPEIVRAACATEDCAFDYTARFVSHGMRYRERIANRAWAMLGAEALGGGGGAGARGGEGAPGGTGAPGAGAPPPGGGGGAPPPDGGKREPPGGGGELVGPPPDLRATEEAGSGEHWIRTALADARASGIPSEILVLPTRDRTGDPAATAALERLALEGGATFVPSLPLGPGDFTDESHPTLEGARRAAAPLADALRLGLAGAAGAR